jgi:hypothetical protein
MSGNIANGKIKNPLKQKEFDEDEALFQTIEDIVKRPIKSRILVYGSTHTGKTHFACTMPEPVFILDSEDRAGIIIGKFSNEEGYAKNIKIAKWTTFSQLERLVNASLRMLEKHYQNTCEFDDDGNLIKEGEVGTIVIDSMSQAWDAVHEAYIDEKFGADAVRTEVHLDPMNDYKTLNEMHNSVRESITTSRFNCCFTCTAKSVYDKEDRFKITGLKPEGQKKNTYMVDVVLFMYNINGVPHCDIEKNSLGLSLNLNEKQKMTYDKLMFELDKVRKKSNIRTKKDLDDEKAKLENLRNESKSVKKVESKLIEEPESESIEETVEEETVEEIVEESEPIEEIVEEETVEEPVEEKKPAEKGGFGFFGVND